VAATAVVGLRALAEESVEAAVGPRDEAVERERHGEDQASHVLMLSLY
jgi:hypothetical protein